MATMKTPDFINHMAARRATNRAKREAVGTGLTSLEEMEVTESDVKGGLDPAWEVKQPQQSERPQQAPRPAPEKPQDSDSVKLMDQLHKLSETGILDGETNTRLVDWLTREHTLTDIKTAFNHYRKDIEIMEACVHFEQPKTTVAETVQEIFGEDAPVSAKDDWLANFREQDHKEMTRLVMDLVERNTPRLDGAAMTAMQTYKKTWSVASLEALNKTQLLGVAVQLWTVLEKGD